MTKEDKQFFTGLVTDLRKDFRGLDVRVGGFEGRFDGLESRFDNLEGRFDGLTHQVVQNTDAIRHNGVRIEMMQSDINLLSEGHEVLNAKLDTVLDILTSEYPPALKQTLANHESRIEALEAKHA